MPKRKDIHKILIIGSGPIVIGQGCEFDYSGAQACKVLRQEGFKVILVNSNPATIMTDPEMADKTYIEPITHDIVEKIIAKERPDSLLPTLGGQTGLNTAVELAESGVLKKYKVRLLGASLKAIKRAEENVLDYSYIAELGQFISRDWEFFRDTLDFGKGTTRQNKRYWTEMLAAIAVVRTALAHHRYAPDNELMRTEVYCNDISHTLQLEKRMD